MTLLNTSLNAIEIRFPRRLAVLVPVAAACGLLLIAPLGQSRGDAAQAPPAPPPVPMPPSRVVQAPYAPAPSLPPSAVPGQGYQTYLLRYKYANGLNYKYSLIIDIDGTIAAGSAVTPIHSHETGIVQLTCHDVPADGSQATVTYRYLSLIVTVNGLHRELSDAQLRQLSEAMPSMRTTQSGKLVSVGSSASPGPISEMMSSSQMLQGAPLPEAATAIGGTWRGVASALGAKTYALSSLDSVATDSKGDQIFTINQKLSEQSTQNEPTSPTTPHLGRFYIYETGTGQQTFDNTLGTLQGLTFTIGGKVTAQRPGSATPVRTTSTTTVTMQLLPPSAPVPST